MAPKSVDCRLSTVDPPQTVANTIETGTPSRAYALCVLVLSVFSLIIMVGLLLPLTQQTNQLLLFFDNLICIPLFIDFAYTLKKAPDRRRYFIDEYGWLDLLGSVPAFGFFKYAALLRLARLSRIVRILRRLRADDGRALIADIVRNRASYAAFITVTLAMIV